tara:strand:- start:250 stop:435 length:186 start_codon:yes stop_codon:yes gene_type:complete
MSKICEMSSTGSSSCSKGMRNDARKRDLIKNRQKKRNDIDDINEFMKVMANICPEYYGGKS